MNAYFFKMTKEERDNILDKHKSVYDGFVTQYVKPNQDPLYVQDYANDKGGLTVSNKGNITQYKNMNINESIETGAKFEPEANIMEDDDLIPPLPDSKEMSEQMDMIGDGPDDLQHGTYDEKYFQKMEQCPHCDGMGYDEFTDEECEWCDGYGEIDPLKPDKLDIFQQTKWKNSIEDEIDGEQVEPLREQLEKSLDMFRRFNKYN